VWGRPSAEGPFFLAISSAFVLIVVDGREATDRLFARLFARPRSRDRREGRRG